MEILPHQSAPPQQSTLTSDQTDKLMEAAQALEASFLTEMLKSAGVGQVPSEFGGGAGEDQFASFLREEQAREMTRAGGIGLAQHLFNAMVAKHDT